jgi:hydroxyacylglutathione hydrolase
MLSVEPIKAFTDNYIWLVSTNEGSIVIDPGESKNIQKLIDNKTIDLKGILITHHHYDHTNGLSELVKKNELEVYGPVNNIDGINHRLNDKDKISIIGIDFDVMSIPGHTLDHIGFYSANANNPILFCGDTLFAGGCGKIFEGTYEQMFHALKKITKLPTNTNIYCGHEYTLSNLKFALEADDSNKELIEEFKKVENKINSNIPSLPTTLDKELKVNPFLRCDNINIQNKIIEKFNVSNNELEVFTALRKWKDNF